ncbi:MAG: anthranilate synthase component I family protein [Planctomycetota bacterium]|nr:anthranilate synthase component I family protein [Planctomycetota bacterium]
MRKITPHPEWSQDDVLAVAMTWPADQPMAVLHSGGSTGPWTRWSMIAPPRGHLQVNADGCQWRGPRWPALEEALANIDTSDPLAVIDAAVAADRMDTLEADCRLPFMGGWLVSLRYELGSQIEPATQPDDNREPGPLADLLWCPDALVHDGQADQWWQVGSVSKDASPEHVGTPLRMEDWISRPDQAGFEAAVQKTIELIRRGDLFQANIARQLTTTCHGDLRGFALDALASSGAWFGCWLELPGASTDRAVLSLSPELFLDLDGDSNHLRTRPIKGTRSAGDEVSDLVQSDKDAAELNMIVDLMRNDLGRVCTIGSIQVSQTRMVESHPTVHHGVAEVSGSLQPGRTVGDILRATFPPGSVTGAPKIRAMQVINELEGQERGAYCGAVGCLSTNGDLRLGVSIRTAAFQGTARHGFRDVTGTLQYGTGCGIVVDSDPADEYHESEVKAEALRRLSRRPVTS